MILCRLHIFAVRFFSNIEDSFSQSIPLLIMIMSLALSARIQKENEFKRVYTNRLWSEEKLRKRA